jgi:hypothetical protein
MFDCRRCQTESRHPLQLGHIAQVMTLYFFAAFLRAIGPLSSSGWKGIGSWKVREQPLLSDIYPGAFQS